MRKYYFLINPNTWSKPLNVLQVFWKIYRGEMKEFSIIWHEGLCPNRRKYPDSCIHLPIKAIRLKFVKSWMFKKKWGVNILFNKQIQKVKKFIQRIKSPNDRDINIPINVDELSKHPKEREKKYLVPSLRAISTFAAGGEYDITLNYRKLDNENEITTKTHKVRVQNDGNGFKFQIVLEEFLNIGGVLYQESYGLNNALILKSEFETLRVAPKSVINFSTKFPYLPQILSGEFIQVSDLKKRSSGDIFLRLVLLTEENDFTGPVGILPWDKHIEFDVEEFNIKPSLMGVSFRQTSGCANLLIDGKSYDLFSIDKSILVIDCLDAIKLSSFKEVTESIKLAFGLLSGKYYSGEMYYVASSTNEFEDIKGIWYEKKHPSIITKNQIVDIGELSRHYKSKSDEYKEKHKQYHCFFSSDVFSKLCEVIENEDEVSRASKLIVNGMGNENPIQKGAMYSVALETLTNLLAQGNTDSLNPIPKDKKTIWKAIRKNLIDELTKLKDDISEDALNILKTRILNLNSPTNKDKLTKTFEIFGLELNEKQKAAINKRNNYLHGRLPIDTEEVFELNQIALELHFLITCLILKYVGYEGHVIYYPFYELMREESRFMELMLEKLAEEKELVKKWGEAGKVGDFEEVERLRKELLVFYKNHEVNQSVRII